MKSYPWRGYMLYMGKLEFSERLPWHYVPVWMLVTIPLLYSVFFIAGVTSLFYQSIRRRWAAFNEHQFLLACLGSIDLVRRPAAEGGVVAIGVVVVDSTTDPSSFLAPGLEGFEQDAFVFPRSPQPLDEGVIHPAPTAVHRDADVPSRCF